MSIDTEQSVLVPERTVLSLGSRKPGVAALEATATSYSLVGLVELCGELRVYVGFLFVIDIQVLQQVVHACEWRSFNSITLAVRTPEWLLVGRCAGFSYLLA